MKKQTIISTIVLSSLLLGATTATAAIKPGATDGQPAERDTAGQVTFEESNEPTNPVDPIDPDEPVKPIDPIDPDQPVEPGTGGPLSLDYASSLNFGKQKITSKDEFYKAALQVVENEAGETSLKPLYAQITDSRGTLAGWSLSIRQNGQFMTEENDELRGARIHFSNGQIATAMDSEAPTTIQKDSFILDASGENSQVVMQAEKEEASGTWIYRFGDLTNMENSVQLEVPGKATKLKAAYKTTLTWSLSTLPDSQIGE